MANLLEAARAYVEQGFSVIPIKADGSKQPDAPTWKPYQSRLPTDEELRQWFSEGQRGIAVLGGAVSGNLEILDFDEAGLCDAFEFLCAEEGLADLVQSLVRTETPSGGAHLYLRSAGEVSGNLKLALTADKQTRIETRGEGGYAIAPPSPASCHPAGKPYRFVRGRPSNMPTITIKQRRALLNLARLCSQHIEAAAVVDAPPSAKRVGKADLLPGTDYNARGDYEGVLEAHGWRRMGQRIGVTVWQRPGKIGRGLSATSGYAGQRLFYCFTSNGHPFEPNRAYSPFAVYSLLKHGGDYQVAARALAAEGYGESPSTVLQAPLAEQARDERPLHVVSLAEVQPRRADWLWMGYIPFGMVTLLEGDPGLGKGTITLDLAARLSRGDPMPLCELPRDPSTTLLLTTAEDDLAVTIKPRLLAAGAVCERIHAITDLLSLPENLPALEETIRRYQARFLVIDPLNAYLSARVDSYRDQDIRRALSPLKTLAEVTDCAILLIHHLNKGTGKALYRGGGSIGISGAARSVLLVAPNPDEEGHFVLSRVKGNLCVSPPSLDYILADVPEHAVARVEWQGIVPLNADELLAASPVETPSRLDEAIAFYREALADGERHSSEVEAERDAAGIPQRTAKRARKVLGVQSRREGFGKEAVWHVSLPKVDGRIIECQDRPKSAKESEPENMALYGDRWHSIIQASTKDGLPIGTLSASSEGEEREVGTI